MKLKPKKYSGFNGIRTHVLCDTSAVICQLPATPASVGHVEIPEAPAAGAVPAGAELGLPLVRGIFSFYVFLFVFFFPPGFFFLNHVSASSSVHFIFGLFRFLVLFSKELPL